MYWNVIYYVSLCHFIGGNILVVFGIDPGYAIVGWGAISFQSNTYRAIGYGSVETEAHTDFNARLEYIYDEVFCKKDGNKEADGIYILTRCRKIKKRILFGAGSVRRADAT